MQLNDLSAEIDNLMADIEKKTGVSSNDPTALSELDALISGFSAGSPSAPTPAPKPAPQQQARLSQAPISTGPGSGFLPLTGIYNCFRSHISNNKYYLGPPGAGRGIVSDGPGAAYAKPAAGRGGGNIGGMATHTPDGKAIKVNAPPCDYCGEPIIGTYIRLAKDECLLSFLILVPRTSNKRYRQNVSP